MRTVWFWLVFHWRKLDAVFFLFRHGIDPTNIKTEVKPITEEEKKIFRKDLKSKSKNQLITIAIGLYEDYRRTQIELVEAQAGILRVRNKVLNPSDLQSASESAKKVED